MTSNLNLFPQPDIDTSRDAWRTPRWLFEALDREFHFICDMVADEQNHLCSRYVTTNQDALSIKWPREGRLWCNPPFSMLPEFTAKAAGESSMGVEVVMLVPAHRCEQGWWHQYVLGVASEILYIRKRVEYAPPPGVVSSGATFPSCLLVYGPPDGDTRALSWGAQP